MPDDITLPQPAPILPESHETPVEAAEPPDPAEALEALSIAMARKARQRRYSL